MGPMPAARASRVASAEGVELAVREYGDRDADVHLVLIHGFPDDQSLWEPVVAHLPRDWHVITYDVRGSGGSSRPDEVAAYRTEVLAEDFIAVLEATVPSDAPFHVAAHDWGSIAFWDVIAMESDDPRLRGRIASYTSASGPSLDHLGTLATSREGKQRLARQAVHSWYVWMFQLPVLPELTWGRLQPVLRPLVTRIDPTMTGLPWGRTLAHNATASVNLYRANVLQRLRHPRPWRTNVPVRLLIATRDGYVTPRSLEGLQARCRSLSRVDLDAGHWHPRTDPETFARLVAGHVAAHAVGHAS
jgi:pimeloyl-ACP methyl ester carboxylesterase